MSRKTKKTSTFIGFEPGTKTIPIKRIIDNDRNISCVFTPQNILHEKLKQDFFGKNCNLSLEEMLIIIKSEMIKRQQVTCNDIEKGLDLREESLNSKKLGLI